MAKTRNMMKHITIILAVMTAVLFLSSCGASGPTPTETTDTFLKVLKEQDMDTMYSVYSGSNLNLAEGTEDSAMGGAFDALMTDQLLPKLLEFEYEISNEAIDGDKATVDVKIKTYRIGDAFTAFISEYMTQALMLAFSDASEEELDAMANTLLAGKLAGMTEKSYEKTAQVTLSKKEDKWMVDEISEEADFFDALSGGLGTAMKTMEEAFSSWDEEE